MREISDVRDILFHAKLCHEAWWILEGDVPDRASVVNAFACYQMVFETLRPGLYTAFVIKLASLFGEGKHDITLATLPGAKTAPEFQGIWDQGRKLYRYRS